MYIDHSNKKSSDQTCESIKYLQKNKNITIKQADDDGWINIMDTISYTVETEIQFNNQDTSEKKLSQVTTKHFAS